MPFTTIENRTRKKMSVGGWINRLAGDAAGLLALLPLLWLGGMSLFTAALFDHDTYVESALLLTRNPLLSFGAALVLAAVLGFILWLALQGCSPAAQQRRARGIVWAAALTVTLLGIVWTVSLHATPNGDQKEVWEIARCLVAGTPDEMPQEYLQTYPHQSGMVLLFAAFIRLFGAKPLPAYGVFSALCAGACVLGLCGLCHQLTESPAAAPFCGMLCVLFLPLPLYSSFVYGTLAAPALAIWGLYGVVRLCRGGGYGWWALPLLLLPLAVATYTGALIFGVAAFIALLFTGIARGWRAVARFALPALLMLALCLTVEPAARALFCKASGVPAYTGMPTIGWVAMGIHSESGMAGPGSYDGSTWAIFWENHGDAAAAETAMRVNLQQYIKGYLVDAERFRVFFGTKTKTQWLDPWFGSIVMCYNPEVDHAVFPATLLCGGALQKPAQDMLLALMTTVYLAAAAGVAVVAAKHRGAVWAMLPAIVFLGGFLFQFVWESKSRYCFPYFMLLLPLAAAALAAVTDKLPKMHR